MSGLTLSVPVIWPEGETSVVSKPGSQGLSGIPGLHNQVVVSLTFFGFFARAVGAASAQSASPSPIAMRILRSVPLLSSMPMLSLYLDETSRQRCLSGCGR